jgi:hypothetical protein
MFLKAFNKFALCFRKMIRQRTSKKYTAGFSDFELHSTHNP